MSRVFQVVCCFMALAALAIFAISCGSGNTALRAVQAIPDSTFNLDVAVNGGTLFTDITFQSINPSRGYQSVSSGRDSMEIFNTGTTTPLIQATTMSLADSTQYTVVLTGLASNAGCTTPSCHPPVAVLFTDNNTLPTAQNVEFRIINASPSSPTNNTVDIYIVAPSSPIGTISPTISGLAYTQASSYQSLPAGDWQVIVTPTGSKLPYVNTGYNLNAGAIRTLVLVDIANGGFMSSTPIYLTDLN